MSIEINHFLYKLSHLKSIQSYVGGFLWPQAKSNELNLNELRTESLPERERETPPTLTRALPLAGRGHHGAVCLAGVAVSLAVRAADWLVDLLADAACVCVVCVAESIKTNIKNVVSTAES